VAGAVVEAGGVAVLGGSVTVASADGLAEASCDKMSEGMALGSVLVSGTVGDGALGDAHVAPLVSLT
jgi:hypothetical protein